MYIWKPYICANIETKKYFSFDACYWKKQSVDCTKTTDKKFCQKRYDLYEKMDGPNIIHMR